MVQKKNRRQGKCFEDAHRVGRGDFSPLTEETLCCTAQRESNSGDTEPLGIGLKVRVEGSGTHNLRAGQQ